MPRVVRDTEVEEQDPRAGPPRSGPLLAVCWLGASNIWPPLWASFLLGVMGKLPWGSPKGWGKDSMR